MNRTRNCGGCIGLLATHCRPMFGVKIVQMIRLCYADLFCVGYADLVVFCRVTQTCFVWVTQTWLFFVELRRLFCIHLTSV